MKRLYQRLDGNTHTQDDNSDIGLLAAPVAGISILTLLLYAFSNINSSNDELASTLTNIVFLYPLFYSSGRSSEGLFAIQVASSVVGAASFNYHERGVIGQPPVSARSYPWLGDLFGSLLVATTTCVVALEALAVEKLSMARSGVILRSTSVFLIVVLPFALDGIVTPPTKQKPELLEPWSVAAFVVGISAAVGASAKTLPKGLLLWTAIILPLVATTITSSGIGITEPSYAQERAIHAFWHATAAISVSFVAGSAGGKDLLLHLSPGFGVGIVVGYLATGLTLLVSVLVDPSLKYVWYTPTILTIGIVLGVAVDIFRYYNPNP